MSREYKLAGVDVEAGYRSVELIKDHVKSTSRKEVLSDIGGFGGMFSIAAAKDMQDPVLISGADGVGTKLKLAFLMNKHDSVGIDCVAMCVNDVVCSGAEPLFFLDYIACGKNIPEKIAEVVKGVAEGCKISGAALIGGETAEMPGMYKDDEYDLAGFAVGLVDRASLIDGRDIVEGDCILGLASNGLHSNGFSMVRKLLRPNNNNMCEYINSLGMTLGEELMKPTRIYVKTVSELKKTVKIKGISNITGGGFFENIPRIIPDGLAAKINYGSWKVPPIFELLKGSSEMRANDMFGMFNMGVGMIVIVNQTDKDTALKTLRDIGEEAYMIGDIVRGTGVEICSK